MKGCLGYIIRQPFDFIHVFSKNTDYKYYIIYYIYEILV